MLQTLLSVVRRYLSTPMILARSGSPRIKSWQNLEKSQFYSRERLENRQWATLKLFLNNIYKKNKFYQKRFASVGLRPNDITTLSDFKKIPLLAKEEIQDNTDEMLSKGYNKSNLKIYKTGGSTGKPLNIYLTEECAEIRNAVAWRNDRWSGWEIGEPIGAVWGNPYLPKTIKDKLKWWLHYPIIYLDTMDLTMEAVKAFAKEWNEVQPSLIYGHAHSIYLLACYIDELGIQQVMPQGIIASSMMLLPSERDFIESVFGVKVTNRYGCEEVNLIASECEIHKGMHLNIDHLFVEILREDGSDALPGEAGQIVVTDMLNLAMPFVRYKIEDWGVMAEKSCVCGRGLPLLKKIVGRSADFLKKKDGGMVAGISLIENTLTKFSGINQMQIVQESLEYINLNLVPGKEYNPGVGTTVIEYFQEVFSCEVSITILEVIPQEKNGKFRFAICNC